MRARSLGVRCVVALLGLAIAGCTPTREAASPTTVAAPTAPPQDPGTGFQPVPPVLTPESWIELFPGLRLERAKKLVEFDGIVPINAHDATTPIVYLEAMVCGPDSKEHESLVMTRIRPSQIHAAMLAAGWNPGQAGSWLQHNGTMVASAPRGDAVEVTFIIQAIDGQAIESPAWAWAKHLHTGTTLTPPTHSGLVFAGSRMARRGGREWYDADGTGLIIGLHSFGSEVIAWREMLNPSAIAEEPVWIADAAKVPKAGTPVRVRIGPSGASKRESER